MKFKYKSSFQISGTNMQKNMGCQRAAKLISFSKTYLDLVAYVLPVISPAALFSDFLQLVLQIIAIGSIIINLSKISRCGSTTVL